MRERATSKPARHDTEVNARGPERKERVPSDIRAQDARQLAEVIGNTAAAALISRRSAPTITIQAKLTVGSANDPLEREADRIAKTAVPGAGSATAAPQDVRRASPDALTDGTVDLMGSFDAPAAVERQIQTRRGGGQVLPDRFRAHMEDHLGADLANVRLHRGPDADTLNQSMAAKAFTIGSDVFLSSRAGDVGTATGQRVLAHELTHVVQQGSAPTLGVTQRAKATVSRLIDLKVAPGTIIQHRDGRQFEVLRSYYDPDWSSTLIEVRALDDNSKMNLTPKSLDQYDVVKPPVPSPPQNLGPNVAAIPTAGSAVPTAPTAQSPSTPQNLGSTATPAPTVANNVPTPLVSQGPSTVPTPKPLPAKLSNPPSASTRATPSPTAASGPTATTAPKAAKPTTPGKILPAGLAALTVDVDDAALDAGSRALKALRQGRAAKVNDALADKLSNCAIATMAAITGAATSGAAASDVRTTMGLPATAKGPQSEKLWTIALLDAETLAKGNMVDVDKSAKAAKNLDEIPQGRSYVLGSAQYHMMIKYLLGKASAATAAHTIHTHGLPGDKMFKEADLLVTMRKYPNGTRFAVFLFSPVEGQHVRQHWVYAENFDGKVIFQDFQTNTAANTPADAYLEKFPFSPDKKTDAGKGFDEGCFIAFAPNDGSAAIPDPQVNPTEIDKEIAEARAFAVLWSERLGKQKKFASTWGIGSRAALDEIPAPATVKATFEYVANELGLTATSKYDITQPGVINLVGHPHVKTQGKSTQIETENLNATTKVREPGKQPKKDPAQLAPGATPAAGKFSEAATESQYTAFSKSYNVMAQNTTTGIEINAERAEFTDLIHEAAHGYEQGAMPPHFREGFADIIASMVSQHIINTTKDVRFEFEYNPTYSHFVVGMQELIDLVGLPDIASIYFEAAAPLTALESLLASKGADATQSKEIAKGLFDEQYPSEFYKAIGTMRAVMGGKTPAVTPPTLDATAAAKEAKQQKVKTEVYDRRKAGFDAVLEKQRLGLEPKGLPKGADPLQIALKWNDQYGNDVMEQRLKLLYQQATEAEGEAFAETMQLIHMHEVGISNVTHESPEEVRLRIKGTRSP